MPWNELTKEFIEFGNHAGLITMSEVEAIQRVLMPIVNAQATDGDSTHATIGRDKSGFVFGKSSLKELDGVKTELVLLARRALELTTQDFCVYDGLRTAKEQAAYVKAGTSRTMNSKHLKGLAVDLVPWVNGKPVWDWDRIYPIVQAVDAAATEQGIAHKIRWGGAWDRTLADFGGDANAYYEECQAYQRRHEGKDFIDGPHFEWVS